jgi:hypothetical protein
VLRRLTGPELDASVRAVFGLDRTLWTGATLPPDPAALNGFTNNAERLTVGPEYAKGALDSARRVASLVTSDPHFARVIPCGAQGDDACANTFLTNVGARLYRRPLTAAERTRYLGLLTKVRGRQGDFKGWVYWATLTMLQSPNFLYRSEVGEPIAGMAGRFRLTPYEVAAALAYTFTGGPPTPELTALAAGNRLATADQVEAAARGLIYEAPDRVRPAFRELVLDFAGQWIGLSPLANLRKDDMAFPQFTDAVQDAMALETQRFLSSVIFDDRGKAADLFTAPYTFVDVTLNKFYGFTAKPTGTTFVKTPRPEGWGVGLLAQGSVMSIEAHSLSTSPTKRGHLVRTRILCGEVPPPPPVVDPIPEPTEAQTTRQRYEQIHVAAAECKFCHRLVDPIGFAFEKLDAVGRFRAKEGQFDIDDRGELAKTSAGDLTVKGPAELAQALARLPEAAECLGAFAAGHAFGVSQEEAACMSRTASDELRAGRISIVDFYARLARAEHFRTRGP